jgi:hypothetical protein
MARENFCFTYYDGDAARDKAHMTRLERGGYDDIISAQRKRGHLSTSDLKRVLGKDFDECWPSIEWILKKDEEGKFFIEWLEISVKKGAKFSEHQRENVQKRWEKNTNVIPNEYQKNTNVIPLEDEDEDEDEDVLENVNEDELVYEFENFWNLYDKKVGDKEKLKKVWAKIKKIDRQSIINHIPKYKQAQPDKKYRKNPETYLNNKSWNDEIIENGNLNTQKNGTKSNGSDKLGTSAARIKTAREW